MKPKEYVKKYNLRETEKFNHEYFVADLAIDFKSNLEVIQEMKQMGYGRFQQCVKEIRDKFDNIFIKSILKEKPEKLWKYFYATVIGPVKDEMFGEYLKKKKEEQKKKYNWEEDYFRSFFNSSFFEGNVFKGILDFVTSNIKDDSCFSYFDLTSDATKEDVMGRFRDLCMIHHPDKGGNSKMFREIVEAKNKCLAYIGEG